MKNALYYGDNLAVLREKIAVCNARLHLDILTPLSLAGHGRWGDPVGNGLDRRRYRCAQIESIIPEPLQIALSARLRSAGGWMHSKL